MNMICKGLAASAVILAAAACSPSSYETDKADLAAAKLPGFSFSVERCEGQTAGRFSFTDPGWDIPVSMSGRVVNFIEPDQPQSECRFYANMEYESLNAEHPGEGRAVACFGGKDPISKVWVTVESGPYRKYRNTEPITGAIEPLGCPQES
ncbi:MAG: hypothetical protein V2I79_04370 [Xanthomonadales bacterium]|nr:hypothetical protein [Xanthomonadales bacterium]